MSLLKFHGVLSLCILTGAFAWPVFANSGPDLTLSESDIRFTAPELIAGKVERLYATIHNNGDTDALAYVTFYRGGTPVGSSQTVSVLAGNTDDVYIDIELPLGSFSFFALIQGTTPVDVNAANDSSVTQIYTSIADTDGDGVPDTRDNCPTMANPGQENADGDEQGDVCDDDRDGDDVANAEDVYPDDASRSVEPVVVTPSPSSSVVPPSTTDSKVTDTDANSSPSYAVSPASPRSSVTLNSEEPKPDVSESVAVQIVEEALAEAPLIVVRQVDWRTYAFSVTPLSVTEGNFLTWDFGDGTTSAQRDVTHAFTAEGKYVISLSLTTPDGEVFSRATTIAISPYHLSNPYVAGTLLSLFFIFAVPVFLVVRKYRRRYA